MKVSVILPLYNKAATIERTLDSIARQTFRNFEVIVVDDGSTDNGPGIVSAFRSCPSVLVRQANAGPGAARNTGARLAQGDLLAFLDADDEWMPEYLERGVERLRKHPEAAACIAGYLEYPGARSTERLWRARGIREGAFRLHERVPVAEAVHRLAYMSPWSTMIRREVFWRWGGFFERDRCVYAEDSFLWLKVLLNEIVWYSFDPLVRFHREDSALSANLSGPRPIEPFLQNPSEIISAAPGHLRDFCRKILSARAAKTACVLGYWGRWREAARLVGRFYSPQLFILPYGAAAIVCGTPIAGIVGATVRRASRLSSQGTVMSKLGERRKGSGSHESDT